MRRKMDRMAELNNRLVGRAARRRRRPSFWVSFIDRFAITPKGKNQNPDDDCRDENNEIGNLRWIESGHGRDF
jgi:hypothetical protein